MAGDDPHKLDFAGTVDPNPGRSRPARRGDKIGARTLRPNKLFGVPCSEPDRQAGPRRTSHLVRRMTDGPGHRRPREAAIYAYATGSSVASTPSRRAAHPAGRRAEILLAASPRDRDPPWPSRTKSARRRDMIIPACSPDPQ